MSDYTSVWSTLQTHHVLLLVDTHSDPSKPEDGYDVEYFESKVEEIYEWFSRIIKDRVSAVDFVMQNNAWLLIRPLVPAPVMPTKQNMKIMVLR